MDSVGTNNLKEIIMEFIIIFIAYMCGCFIGWDIYNDDIKEDVVPLLSIEQLEEVCEKTDISAFCAATKNRLKQIDAKEERDNK